MIERFFLHIFPNTHNNLVVKSWQELENSCFTSETKELTNTLQQGYWSSLAVSQQEGKDTRW